MQDRVYLTIAEYSNFRAKIIIFFSLSVKVGKKQKSTIMVEHIPFCLLVFFTVLLKKTTKTLALIVKI